jgi:ribosomal protein L7Ae-like RNA K-turn-binding protein
VLRLLGLGVRSRGAVVGVERVREAAGRGTLQLAVVAPDASPHSLHKVRPLLAARGVRVLDGPPATTLGHAVGREATAVVGVTDANLARGVAALYETATQQDRGAAGGAAVPGRAARGGPARRVSRRTD